jgi:hypothetical protein
VFPGSQTSLLVTGRGCLGLTTTPAGQKGTMFGQRPNTQTTIYARSLTLLEACNSAPSNTGHLFWEPEWLWELAEVPKIGLSGSPRSNSHSARYISVEIVDDICYYWKLIKTRERFTASSIVTFQCIYISFAA